MPIPLNAKGIQRQILAEVKSRQSILSSRGCDTKIGILLSGDGLSSQSYLRSIQKTFRDAEVGITVDVVHIPEGTPVEAVLERIALLNSDPSSNYPPPFSARGSGRAADFRAPLARERNL